MVILKTKHEKFNESTFIDETLRTNFIKKWKDKVDFSARILGTETEVELNDNLIKLTCDMDNNTLYIKLKSPKDVYGSTYVAKQPAVQCSTISVSIANYFNDTVLEFFEELFYLSGYIIIQISFSIKFSNDYPKDEQIMREKFESKGYRGYVSGTNRRTGSLITLMFKELKL